MGPPLSPRKPLPTVPRTVSFLKIFGVLKFLVDDLFIIPYFCVFACPHAVLFFFRWVGSTVFVCWCREKAQSSVDRLEKALEAIGDVVGPAVEVLKAEFIKARAARSNLPWMTSAPGPRGGSRSWTHNVPKRVLQ